jgi:hypothetical protein
MSTIYSNSFVSPCRPNGLFSCQKRADLRPNGLKVSIRGEVYCCQSPLSSRVQFIFCAGSGDHVEPGHTVPQTVSASVDLTINRGLQRSPKRQCCSTQISASHPARYPSLTFRRSFCTDSPAPGAILLFKGRQATRSLSTRTTCCCPCWTGAALVSVTSRHPPSSFKLTRAMPRQRRAILVRSARQPCALSCAIKPPRERG